MKAKKIWDDPMPDMEKIKLLLYSIALTLERMEAMEKPLPKRKMNNDTSSIL